VEDRHGHDSGGDPDTNSVGLDGDLSGMEEEVTGLEGERHNHEEGNPGFVLQVGGGEGDLGICVDGEGARKMFTQFVRELLDRGLWI